MGEYEEGFADGYALGYENGMFGRGRAPVLPIPGTSTDRRARRQMSKQPGAPKRKGKKDPKMARALKKANSMMRTKSGKLRKGATQAKIMKKAHQLRRKM